MHPANLTYAAEILVSSTDSARDIASFALTHFYLGAVNSFQNLGHGTRRASAPFYNGSLGHFVTVSASQLALSGLQAGDRVPTVTLATPEAERADLHAGDAVYSINARPYTGDIVLVEELRRSLPGQPMALTFWRSGTALDSPPLRTLVYLGAERESQPPLWAWALQSSFLLIPFFCLLCGLYVVFARPLNPQAWLILGVLAYFGAVFIPTSRISSRFLPVSLVWSIAAQTSMPLCLMAFGIYFPERSAIDARFPWIKWLWTVPILALLPFDFIYEFGRTYRFNFNAGIAPYARSINVVENVFSALAISYFFFCLFPKLRTSTGDARRRLRVLYLGSLIGLTPFFILLIISMIRKKDVGQDIPRWLLLTCFSDLLRLCCINELELSFARIGRVIKQQPGRVGLRSGFHCGRLACT